MKFGNRYWLNEDSVRELVDARHLTHTQFATMLGVSRVHWSEIVNGRRSLTPKLRQTLLVALPGDESRLWRVERRAAANWKTEERNHERSPVNPTVAHGRSLPHLAAVGGGRLPERRAE